MAMRECSNEDVRDLLPLLASGRLADDPRAAAESHIAECEACRDELVLLRAARQALAAAPAVDVGRVARAVPPFAASDPKVVPIASRRRGGPGWRIAAAALLLIGGTGALIAYQDRQAIPDASGVTAAAGIDADPGASPAPTPVGRTPRPSQASAGAGTAAAATEAPQLTFGGGLGDLTEDDLAALLAALDETDVIPAAEPDAGIPFMSLDGDEEI